MNGFLLFLLILGFVLGSFNFSFSISSVLYLFIGGHRQPKCGNVQFQSAWKEKSLTPSLLQKWIASGFFCFCYCCFVLFHFWCIFVVVTGVYLCVCGQIFVVAKRKFKKLYALPFPLPTTHTHSSTTWGGGHVSSNKFALGTLGFLGIFQYWWWLTPGNYPVSTNFFPLLPSLHH